MIADYRGCTPLVLGFMHNQPMDKHLAPFLIHHAGFAPLQAHLRSLVEMLLNTDPRDL